MAELYTVKAISEEFRPTAAGTFEKIWRISATTKSGVLFTVETPEAEFNKASVAKLLQQKAKEIEDVKAL